MNELISSTVGEIYQPTNVGDYAALDVGTNDDVLVEMWVNRKKKGSKHTKAQYRRAWRQFSGYVGAPLQAVTHNMLDDWSNALSGSKNTIKTKVAAIKSLFSFAQKVGYIRVNPAIMIESPKGADAKHKRVLSEGEVFALMAEASNARDKAIIRTMYSSGCRISELVALTWADVIPTEDGKAVIAVVGKGDEPRESGISADTYSDLLALRDGVPDTAPVFVSNRGNALDRTVVNRMLQKTAKRAGIDKPVSPHWFRHSHVSHGLARGGNPEAIRQQVGHSSLAITTSYAHASETSADYLAV